MTTDDGFPKEPQRRGRRYELYVNQTDEGLEGMTLARIIQLSKAPEEPLPRTMLVALAGRLYDARRARARFFANSLLGEPVWDMLLALYCLPARKKRLSVTALCNASGVPTSTGLRWVHVLEQKRLIEREPDPRDSRRFHVRLSNEGDELMSRYLASIYHQITAD